MTNEVLTSTQRLVSWVKEEAIPLWVQSGVDSRNGSSFERLFESGYPDLQSDRSIYVQARQIYVFSRAEKMGWAKGLRGLVKRMFEFVGRDATLPCRSDGYVRLLSKDFDILDPTNRLYDHAFFILGSTAAYSAYGQGAELRRAQNIVEWLDLKYKHPAGGWSEGNLEGLERRQSSHMYMFEAFVYLFETTRKEQWLARAKEIYDLLERYFIRNQGQVLFERFDESWQPLDGPDDTILQPGNMLYWSWLISRYEACLERKDNSLSAQLYQRAIELGEDKDSGMVNSQANVQGTWVSRAKTSGDLTHLIKASLRQAAAGNAGAELRAAEAINTLFDNFLVGGVEGTFVDRLDENAKKNSAVSSASNFFHIFNATLEAAIYVQQNLGQQLKLKG